MWPKYDIMWLKYDIMWPKYDIMWLNPPPLSSNITMSITNSSWCYTYFKPRLFQILSSNYGKLSTFSKAKPKTESLGSRLICYRTLVMTDICSLCTEPLQTKGFSPKERNMHYSGRYSLQRDTVTLLRSTTPCWQVSNTRLRRVMHLYSTPPPCLSTRAMGTPDGLWKKTIAMCSTTQHLVLHDLRTYCSHGK